MDIFLIRLVDCCINLLSLNRCSTHSGNFFGEGVGLHDIILVLCLSTKFNEKENNDFFFPKLCINSFHLLAVVETLNTQIWERFSRKYAGILWKRVTKILDSQSNYSTHMYIIIGENRSSSINHRVTLMNCWNRLWLMSFLSPTCFAFEGRCTPSWHSDALPCPPWRIGGRWWLPKKRPVGSVPWVLWIIVWFKGAATVQGLNFNVAVHAFEGEEAEGLVGKFKSPFSHVPLETEPAHSELGLQTRVLWFVRGVWRETMSPLWCPGWEGWLTWTPNTFPCRTPRAAQSLPLQAKHQKMSTKWGWDNYTVVAVFYF